MQIAALFRHVPVVRSVSYGASFDSMLDNINHSWITNKPRQSLFLNIERSFDNSYVCYSNTDAGAWSKAAMGLAIGYGFAWTGHYFFELNKPATFTYPALSLMGDLMLWFQIATLQLSP